MGKPFEALTLAEIIEINRLCVQQFGGIHTPGDGNLLNRGSLEYTIEAVMFPMLGTDLYPGIFDKVAAFGHAIICKHTFKDGNKRTALAVCVELLRMNSYHIALSREVEDYFVSISANSIGITDISFWIRQRVEVEKQKDSLGSNIIQFAPK